MVWYNYLLFKEKKILKSESEFFEKKICIEQFKKKMSFISELKVKLRRV